LTCAGVHSSQRITGTSVMPSFRAAFNCKCPSRPRRHCGPVREV
jgi:hypothetical protein